LKLFQESGKVGGTKESGEGSEFKFDIRKMVNVTMTPTQHKNKGKKKKKKNF
jgi:hypothetical protein